MEDDLNPQGWGSDVNPERSAHSIFNNALELEDPEARARYVNEACAGDPALSERVKKLLHAHDEAGGFFSQTSRRSATAPAWPLTEKAGDIIGRYKLLEQIGEGGCGAVYMAEQQEPVRRRVALKLIKLGMDTKQVVARFEAERQALALMDHPNIARVLDAGATETGRPYFVMELVRGIKITEFCDQKKLSTHQRLELFIAVCQAVQHAHEKGIIHRDLKPSNILVTTVDGASVPKVIDFGVAKAVNNQPLTDKTLFTAFAQFIGTPAYMSPEQADGVDIDPRTDIYSLGVVLYELLTGRTPFNSEALRQAGIDQIRRTIREQNPPKPSTRLQALTRADLTTTAQARHLESHKLLQAVKGDLDLIVMKCLEKERGLRYQTPTDLAADIRRHQNNEPVLARAPSCVYRFGRLVRRRKLAFSAGATVLSALILAALALGWASKVAERDASNANPGSTNLQAIYVYNLGKADLMNNRNEQQLLHAVGFFEQAVSRDTNFARAYVGLASACRQLNVLYDLGNDWNQRAFAAAARAIELNPRLAEAYVARGALYFTPFKQWDAQRDVADQQFALKLDPKVKSAHFQKAFVFYHYGFFEEALEEVRQELKNFPTDQGLRWLEGRTLCALGKYQEGRAMLDSVPDQAFPHLRIAGYCKALAYMNCGDNRAAEALIQRLLSQEELINDPLLVSVQAIISASAGRRDEAEEKIAMASKGESRFIHFHHVAYNIGSAYALMGKTMQAIEWLRKSMLDGNPCYPSLKNDPNLNMLQNDQNFMLFLEEQHKLYLANRSLLLGP